MCTDIKSNKLLAGKPLCINPVDLGTIVISRLLANSLRAETPAWVLSPELPCLVPTPIIPLKHLEPQPGEEEPLG